MDSPSDRAPFRPRLILTLAWICIATMLCLYGYQTARAGVDLREDFWVYWQNNRFYADLNTALHHGQNVLREATDIEQADQTNSIDPSQPTIANPGEGLFGSPKNLSIILQRWHRLRPVYGHIFRGWVATYDHLLKYESNGDYGMDYPPLRSLVMTLWTWKVQSEFPTIQEFPTGPIRLRNHSTHQLQMLTPDVVHPLLMCSMTMEAISSIAMFFLVWVWVRRDGRDLPQPTDWRLRWGDPLLLAPPILLGIALLLRPAISFQLANFPGNPTLIDERFASIGWWIVLLLKFISAVSLARFLPRPFNALACAVVAGTFTWLNPATILESFGWPQWEAWLLPFFLITATLISVEWWLTAGLVLGVGCMFKGQLLLISPLFLLSPLLAGWMGRFIRIITGFATGFGMVVWPWLVTSSRGNAYITAAITAAVLVCIASIFSNPIWQLIYRISFIFRDKIHLWLSSFNWITKARVFVSRRPSGRGSPGQPEPFEIPNDPRPEGTRLTKISNLHWLDWTALSIALMTATILSLLIYKNQEAPQHKWTILLTLATLITPWLIPRRSLGIWLTLVFAAALWLCAFSLDGSFSWWTVGFIYGTQKHKTMQLGTESLSNLSSLLDRRYGWSLHDAVGTWHLPFAITPIELDLQSSLAILFEVSLLLCTIAAAIHLRRNDKKFLVAMVAPWMLFVTLLTQMAARYTMFPAVIAAALVGVSVGMSLFQALLVTLSCVMIGNQLLNHDPSTAPTMHAITSQTFPDMGWLMLLLAGVLLISALTPSRRHSNHMRLSKSSV